MNVEGSRDTILAHETDSPTAKLAGVVVFRLAVSQWPCVIPGGAEAAVCSPMLLSPVSRVFARNRGSRHSCVNELAPAVACRPGALFTTSRRRNTPLSFERTDGVRRLRRRTASVAIAKAFIMVVPLVMNSAPGRQAAAGAASESVHYGCVSGDEQRSGQTSCRGGGVGFTRTSQNHARPFSLRD